MAILTPGIQPNYENFIQHVFIIGSEIVEIFCKI